MSIEGRKVPSLELSPRAISDKLIEKLGTPDIPFTFRTANDSVYVSDRALRTLRYRAANMSFQPASNITVYMDSKFLGDAPADGNRMQYVTNSLFNENGRLILDDSELIKSNKALVESFADIPTHMDVDAVRKALHIVIYDSILKKTVRKIPVSLMPKIGFHPVEFCDPKSHQKGHRNHLGNPIEDLVVTNRMSEEETRTAIESLAIKSVENKKNQPPPKTLNDLDLYLD